jgi:phage major head subunit gpT-like protein
MSPDLLTRRATLEPSTIDAAARTVEVIWSTGAAVRRRDAAGPFDELLSLDPAHVDLSRLLGAPVLDSHRQESLEHVLGVVTDASVDGTLGRATVKVSERRDDIWQDIQTGIIRGVSIGYTVEKWHDGKTNGTRTRTAVQWTPKELSLVAVPADAGASVRGDSMDKDKQPDETDETPKRAATNAEIRSLVDAARLERSLADNLIDREASVDDAKRALFDELTKRTTTVHHQRVDVGTNHDAPEERLERMSEALACRLSGAAPKDGARPYMHKRLVDMAGELLELRGVRGVRVMSPDTILTRAVHTTSDFPNLLTGTGNRVLLAAFQAAPNPLKSLARQTSIADFRVKTAIKLGDWPRLELVNEAGEVHYGTRAEAKEAYKLNTYAKLFSLSRQALINDDLGAFADFGRAAGRAAAETEMDVLVALLTANSGAGATLDDGNPLFHTAHGNLASTPSVIDVTNLTIARLAMRSQKGIDGQTFVNATPRFLLVSATKEVQAETVLAPLVPAQVSNVNPFAQKLELLVEPRLTGNPWYLFADPATQPVLEYAYFSSAPGPQMTSREGWDVLGMEFRVVEDFGAGVVDYRGAYRNAGA